MKKVAVIGAGAIGASSALKLAELGYKVDVYERNQSLCLGASGANGAQLSYNYTDALGSPQLVKSMPKFILGMDPSFRFSTRLNIDFLKWGIDLLKNSTLSRSDENTLAILRLSLSSKTELQKWNNDYGFKYSYQNAGKLHLYETKETLDEAARRVELKNKHGGNQEIIDQKKAFQLEPTLHQMNANIVGAVYSPDDDVGDVEKFVPQAIEKSLEIGQGRISLDCSVEGIDSSNSGKTLRTSKGDFSADYVVVCTGANSNGLLTKLGVSTPKIVPVSGYSLTFPKLKSSPTVSLTDVAKKIVLCCINDRLRVAGMADIGMSKEPRRRIAELQDLVRDRFPNAVDYTLEPRTWCGQRPMTSSSVPVIGESNIPGIYLNIGHGMLGWTLAAGSAKYLSTKILKS